MLECLFDQEGIRFSVGDSRVWKLGPLELHIRRTRREWRIGYQYDLRPQVLSRKVLGDMVETPPELDWSRWPSTDDAKALRFVPVMPDRPVVVRPDAPITLNPGRGVDFFTGIPVWIAIYEVGPEGQALGEIPSRPLSDTWFGDLDEGEFCYASITAAVRFIDELSDRPNRVACKLNVRNDNDKPLVVERICLRTQFLEIYGGNTALWTPEGRIIYRGINQANQVIFGRGAPPFDDAKVEVGGRDGEQKRGFLARSIATGLENLI